MNDLFEFTGEFYSRPKQEIPVGERSKPIRQHDNLYPEGEFVGRPEQSAPLRGDRMPTKRPEDNLRPEGNSLINIFISEKRNCIA